VRCVSPAVPAAVVARRRGVSGKAGSSCANGCELRPGAAVRRVSLAAERGGIDAAAGQQSVVPSRHGCSAAERARHGYGVAICA
jgi:hypothetical protein